MDIKGWASESLSRTKEDGLTGVRWSTKQIFFKILQSSSIFRDSGTDVYTEDWDLLIILDACRLDLMKEVKNMGYIDSVQPWRSVSSNTKIWMKKTFSEQNTKEVAGTGYICGNPWSANLIDDREFDYVEHVWKNSWMEDPGTVPPDEVTDATIRAGRNGSHERVIAHYMQPHCPFIPAPELGPGKDLDTFGNQPTGDIWDALEDERVSIEEVWDAYKENLKLALDDLERLLNNFDAEKVVITSDHGNAIGEWGVYGHHPNMPLNCLRNVPWIVTQAIDSGTATPRSANKEIDVDREDQLKSLGYL